MNLFHFLAIASVCGFIAASVLQLGVLRVRNRTSWLSKVHDLFFTAATIACVLIEIQLFISQGTSGLTGFLLAAILGIGALYLYLRRDFPIVLAITAPVNVLILLVQIYFLPHLSLAAPRSSFFISEFYGTLAIFHAYMAILGQAIAVLAAMMALVYVLMHYALKRRNLRALQFEVPSLDLTQKLLTTLLWSGFGFLTLALISGAWMSIGGLVKVDYSMQLKVIWALAVWSWYLSIIMAKNIFRAPLLRVAQMNLVGFLLMASTFFGVLVMKTP